MRPALVPELICSDFEKSLDFYTRLLDFTVLYDRPEERFAYLERNGAELMLEQPASCDRLFPKAELERPYGRGVNFQITVADVTVLHQAFVAEKWDFYLPLEERWYRRKTEQTSVRQFAVQDPDGYLIRLSQSLGRREIIETPPFAVATKASPGPSAARSQDFLYGEDGLPE
jgi:catechol 2,3-dioxygenase-like lactoylglutathione lyase family enzyme